MVGASTIRRSSSQFGHSPWHFASRESLSSPTSTRTCTARCDPWIAPVCRWVFHPATQIVLSSTYSEDRLCHRKSFCRSAPSRRAVAAPPQLWALSLQTSGVMALIPIVSCSTLFSCAPSYSSSSELCNQRALGRSFPDLPGLDCVAALAPVAGTKEFARRQFGRFLHRRPPTVRSLHFTVRPEPPWRASQTTWTAPMVPWITQRCGECTPGAMLQKYHVLE